MFQAASPHLQATWAPWVLLPVREPFSDGSWSTSDIMGAPCACLSLPLKVSLILTSWKFYYLQQILSLPYRTLWNSCYTHMLIVFLTLVEIWLLYQCLAVIIWSNQLGSIFSLPHYLSGLHEDLMWILKAYKNSLQRLKAPLDSLPEFLFSVFRMVLFSREISKYTSIEISWSLIRT